MVFIEKFLEFQGENEPLFQFSDQKRRLTKRLFACLIIRNQVTLFLYLLKLHLLFSQNYL